MNISTTNITSNASSAALSDMAHGSHTSSNQSSDLWQLWLPRQFIPYLVWLLLVTCIGTIGNILIIASVTLNKKLQVMSNIYVVNLAIADIFVTAIIIPFVGVGLFNDAEFFDIYPTLCITLGVLVVICCGSSIWSIAAISLERYIHICISNIYPRVFNRFSTPFIIIFIWMFPFLCGLPYFEYFGWGRYKYLTRLRICTWTYTNYLFSLYLIILGLVPPMVIIPYCYVRIYLFVRESKKRVLKHKSNASIQLNKDTTKWKAPDTKILKVVATIWAVFMAM